MVLVQKFQDNYNKSIEIGHIDIINLKKDVINMKKKNLFKWKHYPPYVIVLTARWHLQYNLNFCYFAEMM